MGINNVNKIGLGLFTNTQKTSLDRYTTLRIDNDVITVDNDTITIDTEKILKTE